MAGEDKTGEEAVDLQGDDEEMMARLQEEIRKLPVGEHLGHMMHSLSTLAVGRMGLTPETAASRDLDQARLAIDAFKALLGVLEQAARPAQEIAAHRGMLSQLQLTYVGAMEKRSPAETEGTSADSPDASASGGEDAPADAGAGSADAPAGTTEKKTRKPRRGSQTGS